MRQDLGTRVLRRVLCIAFRGFTWRRNADAEGTNHSGDFHRIVHCDAGSAERYAPMVKLGCRASFVRYFYERQFAELFVDS